MANFLNENKWQILILTLCVGFLYAFGINGPLLWDDLDWIVNNPFVQSFTWTNFYNIFTQNILAGNNGISNYYRPLLLVSLMFNYLISGTSPFLYHFVNDLIHLTNGILIYYLVLRWLGKKRIALIASLLFLIHPLQTEAVSYVVGRGDPMSVLFILIGIILFINRKPWLTGVAMILAILTRETGILFPIYLWIVLLAFEYKGLFWERFKKTILPILPYILISTVYGVMRLTILNFQNTLNFSDQKNFYTEHVIYRIYTFFDALTLYVRLIIWPTGLHFFHDIPASMTFWEGLVWLGFLIIMTGIIWLFWLYLKKDKTLFNIWFFGLGIFFANLSLSSGIIATVNARALEHWLYFSLFGSFIIIAYYIDKIWLYLDINYQKIKVFFVSIFIIYCGFLGYQTIARNLIWADAVSLFKNTLKYEPNEYHSLNNLGNWYYEKRDSATAISYWERARESSPYAAAPYTNLGYVANDEGRIKDAEKYFREAIYIDPYYYNAYRNLSALYTQQGMYSDAIQVIEQLQNKYPKQDFNPIIEDIKNIQKTSTTTPNNLRN